MEPVKHSGIGVASFITSIVFCLLAFIAVLAADMLALSMPDGIDEQSTTAIILGLSLAGSLIALRLGVGGVSQAARKKVFAVLGIVLATATIFGIALIMAFGFTTGRLA